MKLSFATGNNEKFAEASAIFPELSRIDIDLPEIQSTDQFEIVQAKLSAALAQGLDRVMVEDTGLELECLGGLPGPFIKFFIQRLGARGLFELASKLNNCRARAVTVAACSISGRIISATGIVQGTLVSPRGDGGFGFDPIFVPENSEYNSAKETYAEMTQTSKLRISHRGLALRNLRSALEQSVGD